MSARRTIVAGRTLVAAVALLLLVGWTVYGEDVGPYKMSTTLPPGIAMPDKVETRLGTLEFFDGFPTEATVDRLYDSLDFQRAVQAYLMAIPAVSQAANRNAILQLGPANTTVPIFEERRGCRRIFTSESSAPAVCGTTA